MTPAERLRECDGVRVSDLLTAADELDRLTAENERLREQIGGYPSVDDLRMAMVLCADENKRLREACQAALNRGTLTGSAESILRAALRGSEP